MDDGSFVFISTGQYCTGATNVLSRKFRVKKVRSVEDMIRFYCFLIPDDL